MKNNNLYPPSPENLPKKLKSLPSNYKIKASLAILAIIIFFVLYSALVVALGYLVYYAFTYNVTHINKFTILLKIGAIAGSAMLFAFTLKFIFKLKNHKRENRIKLKKTEYPEIWNFTLKVCEETGAPKPKNIYIDPDVNAYVSYTNMWLSLFLPIKKELTIGLGLIDCLNLTEFKAVISHEFGHFAQKSMKIGSYIMSANTIIHDMIFSRDKWDDTLDSWRASDIRLSAAAWVITPVIWVIRQILSLFYQFLNIMYSSLSREMEFNADKVAVSTSGSQAIVSALWHLDYGFNSWNFILSNAYTATQKEIFVKNLYIQNKKNLDNQLGLITEQKSKLPIDDSGNIHYFLTSETSKVNMYASHPPNNLREKNAKTPFIPCEEIKESPWVLFGKYHKIQEQATSLIYKTYFLKTNYKISTDEKFEDFIIKETKGDEILKEYQNTFTNRFINIPDNINEVEKEANKTNNITTDNFKILMDDLTRLMQPVNDLEKLMLKAQDIANGVSVEKSFKYKNKEYNKRTLDSGYQQLIIEREKLFTETFKEWDLKLCAMHLSLAKEVNKEKKLKDFYIQHHTLSNIYKTLTNVKNKIIEEINFLQSKGEVEQSEVRLLEGKIVGYADIINDAINKLDNIAFIELPNIDNLDELKAAIINTKNFIKQTRPIFDNGKFEKIMTDIDNAIVNCQRIDQKSISELLLFHHDLQEEVFK